MDDRLGLRGGSGGARAVFCGDGAWFRVISGVELADGMRGVVGGLVIAPVDDGGFALCGRGGMGGKVCKGPSSTTQSLRSMSDVFAPSPGGSGDGDLDTDGLSAELGCIGEYRRRLAVGEIGSSNGFGGGLRVGVVGIPCDSKTWILD